MWLAMALLFGATGGVLALDNGLMRVEADPAVMALRFLGPAEGPNLVEPLYVSRLDRRGQAPLDAGGLSWEILGIDNAALRRGPAEVLRHSDDALVLLSPVDAGTGLQLKLELLLDESSPALRMRATVTSQSSTPSAPVAVRSAARLWPGTRALVSNVAPPALYPLSGPDEPVQVGAWDGTLLNAGEPGTLPALASVLSPLLTLERGGLRAAVECVQFGASTAYLSGRNLHAVNHPATRTYGLVTESPFAQVDAARPLVHEEVWRIGPLE